jgi:hypothetical protein
MAVGQQPHHPARQLDEFLRGNQQASDMLAEFLASNGHQHPGHAVSVLIDEASVTALRLRQITSYVCTSVA